MNLGRIFVLDSYDSIYSINILSVGLLVRLQIILLASLLTSVFVHLSLRRGDIQERFHLFICVAYCCCSSLASLKLGFRFTRSLVVKLK